MKKILIWILVLISLLALMIRFSGKAAELILGIKTNGGISILSTPDGATVFLDDKEAGKTPYENKELDVKEYSIVLEKEEASWQGRVSLNEGTLTAINRDLSKDQSSSAGEVLTLDKGGGITVISNPSESSVEIDGKLYGKTPITVKIEAGEHTILVSHPSYLKRSIRVSLPDNYHLTVSTDLALSEADLSTVATPPITTTPEVTVKDTPTGFLRVRDKASLQGKEIAQVKPGDSLILLEELGSWVRVRLTSGTEGFVSSIYVSKKTTP